MLGFTPPTLFTSLLLNWEEEVSGLNKWDSVSFVSAARVDWDGSSHDEGPTLWLRKTQAWGSQWKIICSKWWCLKLILFISEFLWYSFYTTVSRPFYTTRFPPFLYHRFPTLSPQRAEAKPHPLSRGGRVPSYCLYSNGKRMCCLLDLFQSYIQPVALILE